MAHHRHDRRTHRRRKKLRWGIFRVLFIVDLLGMVGTMAYSGVSLKYGVAPWFAVAAFPLFFLSMFIPALKDLFGFADRYSGIEESFYERHVDDPLEQGEQEIIPVREMNVWVKRQLFPVIEGLFLTILAIALFITDPLVHWVF